MNKRIKSNLGQEQSHGGSGGDPPPKTLNLLLVLFFKINTLAALIQWPPAPKILLLICLRVRHETAQTFILRVILSYNYKINLVFRKKLIIKLNLLARPSSSDCIFFFWYGFWASMMGAS